MVNLEKLDGYSVFTKKKGKDFKILQLTDIHIGAGFLSKKKDALALAAIDKIIKAASPDLIIITGDMVYPIPIFSGTADNKKQSKIVAEAISKHNIPWAFVFGNHDEERHSKLDKNQLADLYLSYPNCLFEKGDPNVTGVGNYAIKLNNSDGSLNTALMFIDSNMYLGKGFFSGFDVIHDEQTEWYKSEILKLGGGKIAPSLAFFHIPPKEFKEGWEKCFRGSDEATYHLGFVNEKDNYFGYPKTRDCNFFKEMVAFKSCKGMFVGHDHINTLSMTYQGIRLTYGMSIDYLAYKKIDKRRTQRGGTIITIDDNAKFDVKMLPLDDIK